MDTYTGYLDVAPVTTPAPTPAPTMTKQEFIDKINEVGGGNPIDVSAIEPCEKYNQWCVSSPNDLIKWDERIDSTLGRAVFIDRYKEDNPPTDVRNIRFYASGTTQVEELDRAWLTARVYELPFVSIPTPTPTLTPTPTPTPTPTLPPITGECVFPRLITGTLTPRLDTGIIFYRVRCIIDKWV